MSMDDAGILHTLLIMAEKSFSVFVACYLMIRLETRLNNLCVSVQKLISVITPAKAGG